MSEHNILRITHTHTHTHNAHTHTNARTYTTPTPTHTGHTPPTLTQNTHTHTPNFVVEVVQLAEPGRLTNQPRPSSPSHLLNVGEDPLGLQLPAASPVLDVNVVADAVTGQHRPSHFPRHLNGLHTALRVLWRLLLARHDDGPTLVCRSVKGVSFPSGQQSSLSQKRSWALRPIPLANKSSLSRHRKGSSKPEWPAQAERLKVPRLHPS